MSKYDRLSQHFAVRAGSEWPATFGELEGMLGASLPKAARSGAAWWANDGEKAHSRAWTDHGWSVGDVDQAGERVVFRRADPAPTHIQPPAMLAAAEAASARSHAPAVLGIGAAFLAGVLIATRLRR